MAPDRLSAKPLLALRVLLAVNETDPVSDPPVALVVSVPPAKLIASLPIEACKSSVAPELTVVAPAVVPSPDAFVTLRVPA